MLLLLYTDNVAIVEIFFWYDTYVVILILIYWYLVDWEWYWYLWYEILLFLIYWLIYWHLVLTFWHLVSHLLINLLTFSCEWVSSLTRLRHFSATPLLLTISRICQLSCITVAQKIARIIVIPVNNTYNNYCRQSVTTCKGPHQKHYILSAVLVCLVL